MELLKQLMRIPELNAFALAGGTALALRYGHRKSVDLDLFSSSHFENEKITEILEQEFSSFRYRGSHSATGVFAHIDDVKIDMIDYSRYKLIGDVEEADGIRILSSKDLIAMKINAVLRRAVKKDFWDIAELLRHYSMNDFIEFYTRKYPSQMLLITVPAAISYFEDAHSSEAPVSFKGQTWASVQAFIQKQVRDF
ncbi:MAG: nucleotidyl transferase AbiEii/AbiGii toxin family protein, partial [Prevotellaceae bacterium]|nr:nucleotidyl transferase AbiEii/AbiGii toxin family protein [Prevotellaceae bacterium]